MTIGNVLRNLNVDRSFSAAGAGMLHLLHRFDDPALGTRRTRVCFVSASSALIWVVITESLTNVVGDELSESVAHPATGSINAPTTMQVETKFQ